MDKSPSVHNYLLGLCDILAQREKIMREMRGWYIFGDKRPGEPCERLDADAKFHDRITRGRP